MSSAGSLPAQLVVHSADHLHLFGETLAGDLPGWTQGSGVQDTDRSLGAAKEAETPG
jgi:hypothetical protein